MITALARLFCICSASILATASEELPAAYGNTILSVCSCALAGPGHKAKKARPAKAVRRDRVCMVCSSLALSVDFVKVRPAVHVATLYQCRYNEKSYLSIGI